MLLDINTSLHRNLNLPFSDEKVFILAMRCVRPSDIQRLYQQGPT